MNLTWFCYYGIMALFQGVMGVIRFIDRYVHTDGPWLIPVSFQNQKAFLATSFFDVVQLSMLMGGVFMLCGTYLVYLLYQEFTTGAAPDDDRQTLTWANSNANSRATERTPLRREQPSFTAFSGQGNKLGGENA